MPVHKFQLVYVMSELASNVLRADEFAQVFDGFSIGSNDLTQMTLGVDRDSSVVSHLFDERDPAVLKLLKMANTGIIPIQACSSR